MTRDNSMQQQTGVVAGRTGGQLPVGRAAAREVRAFTDEVRVAALHADGAIALGLHILGHVKEFDGERAKLAGDNIGLDMLLCDIEMTAVQQCRRIQKSLFPENQFGL